VVKCEGSLPKVKGKTHYMVNMMYGAECKRHERKHMIRKEIEMELKQNKSTNTKIKV